MRVTILVDDNSVLVDGLAMPIDTSALIADDQHAVQWYGTFGEVEFRSHFNAEKMTMDRAPNEMITDFSPYQSYVDEWEAEKSKQLLKKELEERQQQELEAKLKKMPLSQRAGSDGT